MSQADKIKMVDKARNDTVLYLIYKFLVVMKGATMKELQPMS